MMNRELSTKEMIDRANRVVDGRCQILRFLFQAQAEGAAVQSLDQIVHLQNMGFNAEEISFLMKDMEGTDEFLQTMSAEAAEMVRHYANVHCEISHPAQKPKLHTPELQVA